MKGIPLALALVMTCAAWAQSPGTVVLRLDFKNGVGYSDDEPDRSKWATSTEITPPSINQKNFGTFTHVSDLVQVNGRPVKGVLVCRFAIFRISPSNANLGIADVPAANDASCTVEIFQTDATTPVGSISYNQRTAGRKAPGSPSLTGDGALGPIVGGTGAYFGVGGQMGGCAQCGGSPAPQRTASVREDPFLRRQLGGNEYSLIFHLIPWRRPEIAVTASGPAIAHSRDFTLVSAARPAAQGEMLSIFATGLGPTRPGVDPDQAFPASPLAVVNSPVEVVVGGKQAEVLAAVGFPGTVDGYQINFQVPPDAPKGVVNVQLSSAWIGSREVAISVQ